MLGRQTQSLAGAGSATQTTAGADETGDAAPGPVRLGLTDAPDSAAREPLKFAALYARVSTDRQEKEQTIASQVDALERAAQERGYCVPSEFRFTDEGYLGARLDRPALDRLRDLATDGAFEAVLVYTPDRLARHYAYQVLLVEELQRAGCTVIFLNHAFGGSPEEQMLLQMQGVFAEYERALIQERTRRGRLFAARQGRVNWGGNAPYDYRYLRKTETTPPQLAVEEKEAAVVRQLYQWLVEEQMSSYAIQKRLTERQIPPRRHNQQGWAQSTIIEILRDPLYTGQTHYNRTQAADARRPKGERSYKDQRPGNGRGRALRPKEEWIPIQVPALIDSELWRQAQAQWARNREQATRNNTKHEYLLRGLLVCGRCGRRLVGTWSRLGHGRYVCQGRYPRTAPWSCDGRSLSAARVEGQVWEYVSSLLLDADLLKARYEESAGDPAVISREERESERIERHLAAMAKEVERLLDAYQAGAIELDELQTRRKRSDEHGRALRARREELQQQRREREQEIRLLEGLEQFCASVQGALAEPSFEGKQKVLQLVVDRIIVEDNKLTIRHIVPTGPVRLQTEQHAVTTPISSRIYG